MEDETQKELEAVRKLLFKAVCASTCRFICAETEASCVVSMPVCVCLGNG